MPISLTALIGVFAKYAVAAGVVFSALALSWIQLGITVVDPSTLFGVAGPLVVITVAGFFTIRSSVAKIWRENYEAEKVKVTHLEAEILEQRELKHNALNELAAAKLELAAERAKPDYSSLTTAMHDLTVRIDQLIQQNGER